MSWLRGVLRSEKLIAGVSVTVTLALASVLTVVPAYALTSDRSVDPVHGVSSSDGSVAVADQVNSADNANDAHGTVRLSDQQDDTNTAAMPDNPAAQLPTQVSESIPDDATVVSENLAVTTEGEVKDIETGQSVTDETIVGTQATPADPLAKTDGKSFIPVDASDVKAAVTANGGDANAATEDSATQDSAVQDSATPDDETQGSVTQYDANDANTVALQRSTSAHVYQASLGNGSYGAHWGTYNGTQAFFEQDGTLFAQQARGVIDVSAWQGVIDWAKAKSSGVEGAIIRIGYGSGNAIDKQAQRNINECKRLGIPFGVYLYSYAERASDGIGEGNDVVAKLRQLGVNPSDLTYPVYYDTENWTGTWTGHKAPTDPNVWDGAINNWWSRLRAAGYTNLSVYSYPNYLNTALNTANIHSKTRWVASYGPRANFSFSTNDRGWQYTSQGTVNGINGAVDLNAFGVKDNVTGENSAGQVYRLYHPIANVHHYTISYHEMTVLVSRGWKYEGVIFRANSKTGVPVYRLYHCGVKQHFFTADKHEKDVRSAEGWEYEGIAWYGVPDGPKTIYRLYHSGNKEHFYTTSLYEYQVRGSQGWHMEGAAWKGN